MAESTKSQTSGPSRDGREPPWAHPSETAALQRTSVYRKLPVAARAALDRDLLTRPPGRATLETVAAHHQLEHRYGIQARALRTYARRLERLVRPALASQLVSGLLGCMPEAFRQQLIAGSQVLLLSRVVAALLDDARGEDEEGSGRSLSAADLAKLASVVNAVAGRSRSRGRSRPGRREDGSPGAPSGASTPGAPPDEPDPEKISRAVRWLYGLDWPPPSSDAPAPGDG